MLRFDQVTWSPGEEPVLETLNLTVSAGQLVVMLGVSGVGKTSVLRLSAGLIKPGSGAVVNGFASTAMVFQEPRLMPWATALSNVAMVLERLDPARRAEVAATWLGRLGFGDGDMGKRPEQLSGGMRARVAIARAFATGADLVLMDEPFASLDLGLRRNLQVEVRRLVRQTGVAVLFVTHDLTEAVSLADRIVVLAGRPAQVVADLRQTPPERISAVWEAAAALSVRPELASVVAGLGA
ncbi:MAG: transporter related [Proteobacteria bacterium]|nr:transporter related [Pseudomonadota bacterium]